VLFIEVDVQQESFPCEIVWCDFY